LAVDGCGFAYTYTEWDATSQRTQHVPWKNVVAWRQIKYDDGSLTLSVEVSAEFLLAVGWVYVRFVVEEEADKALIVAAFQSQAGNKEIFTTN
jgi:hypothetical protein